MAQRRAALEPHLDNKLPEAVDDARLFAGSAGESPSKYSRSPGMWNAAFRELGLDAAYVPFDVRGENLRAFISAVREQPGFIGGNVTVPHKLAIMPLLDEIDPIAQQIGAVNTYARQDDGRLVGYNSDADGLLGSMLRTMPGKNAPFLGSLAGKRVLLLGAGGAGRAAAFAIASKLDGGTLAITNRSMDTATELAGQVSQAYAGVTAITQSESLSLLAEIDLVVNASTVGQSGVRHLAGGKATCLEPFSSLAPADPAVLDETDDQAALYRGFFEKSLNAIERNNTESARALLTCKMGTAFVDAVYSPDETTLLRQARYAGFKTLNGKGMLIMQAAESFIKRMARPYLIEAGYDPDTLYDRVVSTMATAFDAQG
ncbi:MAG: shikimate dehydrogenase [Chloroflexi bacterium]|nr:shikimate dehydrogenase [Chloroflexota bacterium]